jgi:anti-sigma regulatory factor (Ser/Thr protein kinase)
MVRHVLLVETGPAAGRVPREELRRRGHRVRLVRDKEDVAASAERRGPGLVVLGDARFCRELKFDPRTADLPFVEVGGPADPAALRVEPEAELRGPATPANLTAAVERALAAKAGRRREGIVAELNVWVPSGFDELEALCELLPAWLAGHGLTSAQVRQTGLAVREIVANAIEWGHGQQRTRLVRVECKADEEKVTILVRDNGPGFDRQNLPHAARPGDPLTHMEVRAARNLREGGFGLLMASGLVDHLCFSETGNEGLLIKYLPSRAFEGAAALAGSAP